MQAEGRPTRQLSSPSATAAPASVRVRQLLLLVTPGVAPRRHRRAAAMAQPLAAASGPHVWRGPELAAEPSRWRYTLNAAELDALGAAADAVAGRDLAGMTRADVALSVRAPRGPPAPCALLRAEPRVQGELGARLDAVRAELLSGCGLALLRGLPVASWGAAKSAAAFWALGAALGTPLPQNKAGHVLGHVKDLGADPALPTTRLYTTAAAQPYHTDSADVVGLLCLAQARSGGDSHVASSPAVFNAVLRERPHLAALLAQPFAWDRKGEVPPGCDPWFHVPVFCRSPAGRVVSMYDRSFINAAQARFAGREGGVERLTPAQVEALDAADAAAASDALRLDMRLEPGDVQLLHSHVTWHSRGAFSDGPGAGGRSSRHLLRLWLAPPPQEAWELPAAFAPRYGNVARDAQPPRGGIRVAGVALCAPLTAVVPV